jgi:hypothetical protein
MQNYNAQPSPSYQSLVQRPDGKVIEDQHLQFNTYSADEPLPSPQFYEHQKEDLVSLRMED